MLYPFLSTFARGVGVDLATFSLVLSLRSLLGMAAPLIAPVADRRGRKAGILLGLGLFTLGTGAVALRPSFATFLLAIILTHIGNMIFLPAMQAYLGDRIPYARRGRALALTELSWSLAFLVGVPLAGLLIERAGWQSVYPLLAGAGLLAGGMVAWKLPDAPPAAQPTARFLHGLGIVLRRPATRAALLVALTITLANELVNLVFGVWMEARFDLRLAALGGASAVIGLAELIGEGGVAALVDRLGKPRAVRLGLFGCILTSLAFPFMGGRVETALVGLFFFYLAFEFTLVSFLPLASEVMPSARATLMSAVLASNSLGRAIGDWIAPVLYRWGIGANAVAAAAINLLAVVLLAWVSVKEEE